MHARGVILTSFLFITTACGTDEEPDAELGETEQEVLAGTFAARFDDTLKGGGVVAQGASLAGREDGAANATANITIAGIPAGATVHRALLYWNISGGSDTTATINGFGVTGALVANGGQTCWGVNNAFFRADVTTRVTGNGTYTIGGLPSSTTATAADTNGAALIVTYQNPASGVRRRVMVRDGGITSSGSGEIVSDTFAGVAAPIASSGQFHIVVGDGQSVPDGAVIFNGVTVGTNQFPGSDGSLWDTNSYNVTVPAGLANATWSSQTTSDCLAYTSAALDFNVAQCGDGARTGGEACEQGNTTNGDGCSSTCDVEPGWNCTLGPPSVCTPVCGDGIRVGAEQCDDSDTMGGDGCSATCTIEPGWTCAGSPSVCTTTCGDGIRAGAESCDDGDLMSGDGCSNTCAVEPGWTCMGDTPSVCTTTCGDGIRAGAESCDDGDVMSGDGCSNTCTIEPGWTCVGNTPSVCTTTCGDGIRAGAESCDDGDVMSGDGCSNVCAVEPGWTCMGDTPSVCNTTCGDGIVAGAEACDDSGTSGGDGCSATCTVEPGWTCTGSPSTCMTTCGDGIPAGAETCDDGGTMGGDGCSGTCTVEPGWTCAGAPSMCATTCGDGIPAGAELCDDGDTMGGDGCSAMCTVEPGWMCAGIPSMCMTTCGDGIPAGAEACDDGDTTADDGCSATCTVEPGWTCTGAPSACTTTCGDGVVAGTEACDDGDAMGGDGCSDTCAVEPGWTCTGEPSVCTTSCGDGIVAGIETCDDANTAADDGCSATCSVEPGWTCTGEPSACDEICGDGLVVGAEACDDGNTQPNDGCAAACTIDPGWSCTGEPSVCTPNCGDGQIAGSEGCDDGNVMADDGCSTACQIEQGWACGEAPSQCASICGDGLVIATEQCDDGNTSDGEGCSATCVIEDNWQCDDGAPTQCNSLTVAGGGCSSTGTSGLSLAAGLLVLMVTLRRRRRGVGLAALVLMVAATPAVSYAQTVSGSTAFPAERFRLSMDRDGVLGTESARAPGHLVIDVGLWFGYANSPVTVRTGDDNERVSALVQDRYGGDLVGSVGIGSRFELGLAAPLVLSQSESLGMLMTTNGELSSVGLGDLAVTPKIEAVRGRVDVAFAATVTLPTGGGEDYRGDDGVTFAPAILVGHRAGPLRLLANLGYRARESTAMGGLEIDDELLARLGFGYRVNRADVMLEAALATAAADPFGSFNANHGELRGGVGYEVASTISVFAAAGVGIASGYGTPDWRALAGMRIGTRRPAERPVVADTDGDGLLDTADRCPAEAETRNAFEDEDGCPDNPDADGDGVALPADKCAQEAETRNNFEDDDGCPDVLADTDGDGLSDPIDSCKDQPEDKDGFEDDNGCPDDDNDKDTVADAADRCPMEAGAVDNGGCPDTDRDGDTVVDRLDNCPDEAGTVQNRGCKDKQLVVLTGPKIELLQIVNFETNRARIARRYHRMLQNVAKVIIAHPEITKVTVEGHADDRGEEIHNKELSQRRAQAVVDFLIKQNVKPELLVPIGYGNERPTEDNTSAKGRAANRRIEFKVETATTP